MKALLVVVILLVSLGGAALVIWQAREYQIPLGYIVGGGMVVIGTGFFILHVSVSDDHLRRHFGGEENAARMRKLWRDGWLGVLIGVALIVAVYFLGANW